MREHYTFAKDLNPPSRYYIELELDTDELQALGHVAAQWAFLEYQIHQHSEFLSKQLLNEDLPKEAINDSFRKRKREWEKISKKALAGLPEHLARVLSLIQRVGSLQHERHRLIHGLIQWNEADRDLLNVYLRGGTAKVPWKINAKRIEETARKIAILNADLLNVHNENPDFPAEIVAASPRRPGTPVPQPHPPGNEVLLRSMLEANKRQRSE